MKLKHTILETLARDTLKKICGDLEIDDVDLRSVEAMSAKLSRFRRATPEVLFEYLSETQVKAAAERLGLSSQGRRAALIQTLLKWNQDGEDNGPVALQLHGDGGSARAVGTTNGVGGGGRRGVRGRATVTEDQTEQYRHANEAIQRPDVGVQDQFQAKKLPKTYRYDSSLDPSLSWDEQRERDLGEWLLGLIERAAREGGNAVFAEVQEWKGGGVRVTSAADAVRVLKDISNPFLNWAGKAERYQINVPTVPLFVHERHSTKAILDGIRHRKAKGLSLDLFGDPNMDIRDQLEAYEHKGPWQNRMILGDSLQVMNSLLEYEGLGGQVQMIYLDPPYGVSYGSNFQPFVRQKAVGNSDQDMSREPETVAAYRDTWELGPHSYLTYLRDRFLTARELLVETGCIFVQIGDANLHYVRSVLDEVFGAKNFCSLIPFRKKTMPMGAKLLENMADYLLWYAKSKENIFYRRLFQRKNCEGDFNYRWYELPSGERQEMTSAQVQSHTLLPAGARPYHLKSLEPSGPMESGMFDFPFGGRTFKHPKNGWATGPDGMKKLRDARRLQSIGDALRYVLYHDDYSVGALTNPWNDVSWSGFAEKKIYAVQTNSQIIRRCMLMTTSPGDLVLDPTCGSGTTAYVAEHWGRRWITIDTSRVPLALARQRLLTATFPYYELKDSKRGPAGGFVYKRRQTKRGEEVGGLVPHLTLRSIANDEQPAMEILVDCPEEISAVTRVSGPFVVEATIAPVQPLEGASDGERAIGDAATHIERMTEVLRQSKTLRLPGNRELVLSGIRRSVDSEYLHVEATEGNKRIAIVFGPQDGAISSSLVFESVREAYFLKYDQIYFFGFAIEANARGMIEGEKKLRMPAVYVAVTPDVAMSDLLKTTRASQIFSITGLPDFEIKKAKKKGMEGELLYQVQLNGLDVFDPESLETQSVDGESVPCWMLDTDYDGMSFYATQVFFPKTSAWDNLQNSLKATFDESVWEHLAGTTSEPFEIGEEKRVAVKVIDERGNELLRVKAIET
jgi:adenine-specific DNA-methyltransferase